MDADYLTQALTAGLPAQAGSPVAPKPRLLAECTECGRPGAPEALPDGLCRPCRTTPQEAPAARDAHALVGQLRDLTRLP
ncbi:hypothetical protein [Streptomyces sp. IBSNAI001]|uniref:hypothetical protein n=1 Tax=Streptomyces sp. IBSNAI001 TaxID=3457499 RepID=UPI003FD1B745